MKPPTAVMVTTAFVPLDGRAQKIARSVANAGWDTWLIGRSETGRLEISTLGRAHVIKLAARPPAEGWGRRHLIDFEMFDEVLDDLRPDLLHAHDVDTLGLAARVRRQAERAGRTVKLVYDAHEYVAGVERPDTTWRLAMLVEESRHIGRVDAVITVIEPLAGRLRERYCLIETPTVVKNAPEGRPLPVETDQKASDVRSDCRLGPEAELLVYSGAVSPARGLSTVVASLPELERVHLALQVASRHRYVVELEQQAQKLGVRGRLHVLAYVAPHRVVDYLRTANAGVVPLLRTASHDLAICSKYFEFMHARLPIVTSDVKLQAQTTVQFGNGEVFRAGDVSSFVEATRAVLANAERYVGAYDVPGRIQSNSWEAQEPALLQVYTRLTGWSPVSRPARKTQGDKVAQAGELGRRGRGPTGRKPRLAIGPSNMAGQAWAWTKALERLCPEVGTDVYVLERDTVFRFSSDHAISQQQWWHSPRWHVQMLRNLTDAYTHVMFEGGLALTGPWTGDGYFPQDAAACAERGTEVGLIFHGSDIRNPRRFRELYPDLPFADPRSELTVALQRRYDALAPLVEGFAGPCFVSTPDLLDFLPRATWLPVTVDVEAFGQGREVMRRSKPVVVHVSSRAAIKGTTIVDTVALDMQDRGLIEYQRPEQVPPERMPGVIAAADIVLDQFAVGSYGALAVQAMAAGRVVVGHVAEPVRARLGNTLPIVEATQHSLRQVLEELIENPERCRQLVVQGREFVHRYHDGAYAGKVLADFVLGSRAGNPRRAFTI